MNTNQVINQILTEKQKNVVDLDGNGEVNAKDALLILKYAVGKIKKFPIEA